MGQEFSFALRDSAELAKNYLAKYSKNPLKGWKQIVKTWLSAKGKLIKELDKKTGRRVWKCEAAPKTQTYTLAKLYDLVHATRVPHRNALLDCLKHLGMADVPGDAIQAGSPVLAEFPKLKAGTKLSRALAHMMTARHRVETDEASATMSKIWDMFKAKACGHLVISANIVDMLMASHNAAFQSCHRPEGEVRAGPQCYLADNHTLIAYFYQDERAEVSTGQVLPYKIWRQLLHVDIPNKAVGFMREYGAPLDDAAHKSLRREAALLLGRMAGVDNADNPQRYISRSGEAGFVIEPLYSDRKADKKLVYTDSPSCAVRLGPRWPHVELVLPHCPGCGKSKLDTSDSLVCSGCRDAHLPRVDCSVCERSVLQSKVRNAHGGPVCPDCWAAGAFASCRHCGAIFKGADLTVVYLDGGQYKYCAGCLKEYLVKCPDCVAAGNTESRSYVVRNDTRRWGKSGLCRAHYEAKHVACAFCCEYYPKAECATVTVQRRGYTDAYNACAACRKRHLLDCTDCSKTWGKDDIASGRCPLCAAKKKQAERQQKKCDCPDCIAPC